MSERVFTDHYRFEGYPKHTNYPETRKPTPREAKAWSSGGICLGCGRKESNSPTYDCLEERHKHFYEKRLKQKRDRRQKHVSNPFKLEIIEGYTWYEN